MSKLARRLARNSIKQVRKGKAMSEFRVKIDEREHALLEGAQRDAQRLYELLQAAQDKVTSIYTMLRIRYDIPLPQGPGQGRVNISPDHWLTLDVDGPAGMQVVPSIEVVPRPNGEAAAPAETPAADPEQPLDLP